MNNKSTLINELFLKDKLNTLSKEINIKKWDFGASVNNDISVQIDKGEPKQTKASQKSNITIRVWNSENLVGTTSTSDLSDVGLRKALNKALEASMFGNNNETPDFSKLSKTDLPLIKRPIRESVGITKLINLLIEAESDLINSHNSIKSVPYNGLSENRYERVYINSEGAVRHMLLTQASLYLFARAEENGRKPRSSGSIKLAHGVNELDINNCIKEAATRTIDHLDYHPITTGKYLVCFKPEAFLDLITAFSNIYNARSVIDGVSLSTKESIGNQVASEILSLSDNGLHKSNIGAFTFDGEGTPTQDIIIIKDGTLKNFIHSEATAREYGVNPTGHASIGAKASVSPDWPVISKSDGIVSLCPNLNFEKSKETFVLVENLNALHAGIKASQGSFSLPFDGWLVKNGMKKSIESATIAGDIISLLNNIIQIENKQFETHQGVSPHIWINELSITGDS
ncbi:TldD/PmbA family protein [Prochlorococcus marinus]|uniref:TldD/PmbA family protein n=1 Tax=Prochlorococcus marinus TaxID=1219 RepID=UPI0022B4361E|nr:TldD/PmbA family protein [Prochlorococcus marinus]